jgi:hypothetical protein
VGLDTSHDCWHGAYSAFMNWRQMVAKAAGMPPLGFMEGYYGYTNIEHDEAKESLRSIGFAEEHVWARDILSSFYGVGGNMPITWDSLKPSPLHFLLSHSDCEGEIPHELCDGIADELEKLLPELPEGDAPGHIRNWRDKTQTFIDGLRLAAKEKENVDFH